MNDAFEEELNSLLPVQASQRLRDTIAEQVNDPGLDFVPISSAVRLTRTGIRMPLRAASSRRQPLCRLSARPSIEVPGFLH